MINVLIFHGTAGSAQGNWFPWMKQQLETLGYNVIVPQFPTPEGESLEAWFAILDQYADFINEETILIGHSKGGMFLLKVLERLTTPVEAAIFVSAPIGIKPILYYDADYKFTQFKFDWAGINKGAKHFEVFHSDTDPYVSLENGKKLAEHLGVRLNFIPDAGHLNAESGYTEFPQLLDKLGELLKGANHESN